MSDSWRARYARHMTLADWGEDRQRELADKTVLIVGLGGLGSPVATYLAASGVGTLILNDFDRVDLSNLPRQPLHGTKDINRLKTESAADSLKELNPDVTLELVNERLDRKQLEQLLADCDCVVDCTDNFGTRFAINEAAVATKTPLISAAAIRAEGQVAVFRNDLYSSPCYRCLYSEDDDANADCQGQGVVSSLVGVIGSMAATATLNLLVFEMDNSGQLHYFDAKTLQWRHLKTSKNTACPVCANSPS
ncbi:MAG: ThiF family adenylyltransferase [Gammaproteobacteria bacterium]